MAWLCLLIAAIILFFFVSESVISRAPVALLGTVFYYSVLGLVLLKDYKRLINSLSI